MKELTTDQLIAIIEATRPYNLQGTALFCFQNKAQEALFQDTTRELHERIGVSPA